jgi:hypothetical protein
MIPHSDLPRAFQSCEAFETFFDNLILASDFFIMHLSVTEKSIMVIANAPLLLHDRSKNKGVIRTALTCAFNVYTLR